ncbi:sensor histidine kinase [Okeania sp. SIO3I5]|uniref:sensor histidine kinase n=1 Tax=Okeania sp. SIO3I5 TaxID=2607805 RepID=UPI0025E7AAA0|nr:ATP-binding protein [Okeania sp. SIO3I5]
MLAFFYRQQAVYDLVTLTEEKNVTLTKFFANTIWQKYGSFLSSTQTLSNEALAANPQIRQLNENVIVQLESLSVVKVKIYDLQGRTVFSTDFSQIGQDKSQTSGFLSAKSGQVISQLGHRDTFKALKNILEDRDLLSSYIPVHANGNKRDIVGVFELYSDVTPLVQKINQTQCQIILGSIAILASLYGTLFLFIQRADRLLKRQYQQLQESESSYRNQADELKRVLHQLQQTQTQILQNEKMSSLGQLVAGVAHEINNPVTFIHGNLHHIQKHTQDLLRLIQLYQKHYPHPVTEIQVEAEEIELEFIEEDLPKVLSSIEIGSKRISDIVVSLRNFSRMDEVGIKAINIHEGLDSTLMILQHRLKGSREKPEIQVIKDYGTIPPVQCYPGMLNQVFMNIMANAIDSLEEMIETKTNSEHHNLSCQITLRTSLIKDKWVQIAIADNGCGIPQEIQERIFEPFFTTKPVGKGTGMGTSISYQIVTEKHQGKLEYFSTLGRGTEVVISIPVRQSGVRSQELGFRS